MTLNNLNQSINKTNAHTCVAVKMAALLTVGPTPMYKPRTPWVWTISLNAEAVLLYRGTSPSKTLPWACILTLTKSVGVAMALPIVPLTNHNHIRFKLCLKKVFKKLLESYETNDKLFDWFIKRIYPPSDYQVLIQVTKSVLSAIFPYNYQIHVQCTYIL